MALLNRFSKLNDRGETGIFTFIVTKSVTRDLHRDATTKDFCFGYHRWAISFQRPTERMLGVHLLLRNASPSTACVVDFSLTLLNREHFSQNQVYSKKQAKFTITNPMQGVSRWIELSELAARRFSNETGEFLFELSLSNMTTIFECDIQLSSSVLSKYKRMLKFGSGSPPPSSQRQDQAQQRNKHNNQNNHAQGHSQLINLDTNHFTFGSFDWSLTIVPLVVASAGGAGPAALCGTGSSLLHSNSSASSSQDSFSLLTATNESGEKSCGGGGGGGGGVKKGKHKGGVAAGQNPPQSRPLSQPAANLEPVCRVYLNRLSGFDSLCRVKYRVILGHHQPGGVSQSADFVDSKLLDQISDCDGRIRGHQFRHTNVLKLASLRHNNTNNTTNNNNNSSSHQQQNPLASSLNLHKSASTNGTGGGGGGGGKQTTDAVASSCASSTTTTTDLRVHIEMFCANTISEARVPLRRVGPLEAPNEPQVANCSDRNKQNWCVECDGDHAFTTPAGNTDDTKIKLKLFFLDLQSVPRNHIRYISWIAYLVRHDTKTGQMRDSLAVRNAPHSNYYLQDGMDLGTIMETDLQMAELNKSPKAYLDANENLTVHIEWIDSLLLFSHLYNNYDALATVQRHQISRELFALQQEFDYLEGKYLQSQRTLNRLLNGPTSGHTGGGTNNSSSNSSTTAGAAQAATPSSVPGAPEATNNNNNNNNCCHELTSTSADPTQSGGGRGTGGARQLRQSSLTTMDSNYESLVSGAGRPEVDQTAADEIEQVAARVPPLTMTTKITRCPGAISHQYSGRQSQPSDLGAYLDRTGQISLPVGASKSANIRCASSMSLGASQHESSWHQISGTNYNYPHHPSGRLSGGDLLILAGAGAHSGQSPVLVASNRSQRAPCEANNVLTACASDHHHRQQNELATTTTTTTPSIGGQLMAVTSHHHQGAAPLTPARSSTRRRLPQPKVAAAQALGGHAPLQRDLKSSAQLLVQGPESAGGSRAWHVGPASGQVRPAASFDKLPSAPDAEDGLSLAESADQQQQQLAARLARGSSRFHETRHSADSTCTTRRSSGQSSYSPTNSLVCTTGLYSHAGQQQHPPPAQLRNERLMSGASISRSGGGVSGGVFIHNSSHQPAPLPLDDTNHLATSPIRVPRANLHEMTSTLRGSHSADEQNKPGDEPTELDNHNNNNNNNNTSANHPRVSMADHRLLQQQQRRHYAIKSVFAPIGGDPQIAIAGANLDDDAPDLHDDNQLPLEYPQRHKHALNGTSGAGPAQQNGHLGSSFSGVISGPTIAVSSSAARRHRSSNEMSPIRMNNQLANYRLPHPTSSLGRGEHHHNQQPIHSHTPVLSNDQHINQLLVSSTKRALSLQQPQEYITDYLDGQYDQQHQLSCSPHTASMMYYRSSSRSDPLVQPAISAWQQQTTFERGDTPFGGSSS